MGIFASYNDHCPAPFYPSLFGWFWHHQAYPGLGAGIVMESITPKSPLAPEPRGIIGVIGIYRQLSDCFRVADRPQLPRGPFLGNFGIADDPQTWFDTSAHLLREGRRRGC